MRTALSTLSVLMASCIIASCSTSTYTSSNPAEPSATNPTNSAANTVRGVDQSGLEANLDKYDQEKMSHALDKPLGKGSEWSNPRTGISYTVTPVAKLTFNGNPYCRRYSIVSSRHGSHHEGRGTACVSASDSSWQIVY